MCGCATVTEPPRPFADEQIHGGGVAYLWTAGRADQPAMSLLDYAIVISIDGRALPPQFRPAAGMQPFFAWRVEVPAGRHAVEVLIKEETLVCSLLGGCLVMEDQTRVIEFVAEAGRAYVPLTDDRCSRKWIWIADAGPGAAEDSDTMQLAVSTGLPAVGGESPPDNSC
jgi:hypothetical protein